MTTAPTPVRPTPANTVPGDVVPPLLPLVGADLQVPLVNGNTIRYVNLDNAASAPALESVRQHVCEVLPLYSSVHRGAGYTSQVSTALYESARDDVARFLGARNDDVVVFTRNTTDSLNLLASAVPDGGEVLFLDIEHHANLLPWQSGPHYCVAAASTLEATVRRLEAALAERRPALLAVAGSSNVTGEVLPLARLAELAHAHGARIVVDAAQLAPHRRIEIDGLDLDYLAFSGHKLYAPFGAGVLVGRRDWLDAAPAHLAGGGAVREVSAQRTIWADAPQRHEGGTPNVLGAAALAAACRALEPLLGGTELVEHEELLRARLVAGLAGVPGVRQLVVWPDSPERVGIVAFTIDGRDPGRVAAYLSAEHGIGLRDGKFCAHPLLARLLGGEGTALRASLGAGSSSEDVDRLIEALRQLVTRGETWAYTVDVGRWVPVNDPRPAFNWGPSGDARGASACEPAA